MKAQSNGIAVSPVQETGAPAGGGEFGEVRWERCVRRYRPMMEEFLARKFPGVDADDAIQETWRAVVAAGPDRAFEADGERGLGGYLTRILARKAVDWLRRRERQMRRDGAYVEWQMASGRVLLGAERGDGERAAGDVSAVLAVPGDGGGESRREWMRSLVREGLVRLRRARNGDRQWQVFLSAFVKRIPAERVARQFGMQRNAVYKIVERLRKCLADIVREVREAA